MARSEREQAWRRSVREKARQKRIQKAAELTPAERKKRTLKRILFACAVSIVCLALAALGFYWLRPAPEPDTPSIATTTSTQAAGSNKMTELPLRIRQGQTVYVQVSDIVAENLQSYMIALGNQPNDLHQTTRIAAAGMTRLTAEQDYRNVYVLWNVASIESAVVTARLDQPVARYHTFSILGDSYSVYEGYVPSGGFVTYPDEKRGVTDVNQMWWSIFSEDYGAVMNLNESRSGSTVCNTGYQGDDVTESSFIARMNSLPDSDLLLVFGGTNDSFANAPLGHYIFSGWNQEDLRQFRPAYAYLLDQLQRQHPDTQLVSILNSELRTGIADSIRQICKYYGVPVIELKDIDKIDHHPTSAGMAAIAEQVTAALRAMEAETVN